MARPIAGTEITVRMEFSRDDVLTDPTTVDLSLACDGLPQAAPTPTRVTLGVWEATWTPDRGGQWLVHVEASGALEVVGERWITVRTPALV